MRAAAILGLGTSPRDLKPFQSDPSAEWIIGLPADRAGLDAILVFGGDGTVHRHLASLVKLRLPVLVIPAGSGNDFARALELFEVRDSLDAWKKFTAGAQNVRTVDLGTITAQPGRNGPSFVSGDRFSDAASLAQSGAPLGADTHQQQISTHPTYYACVAGVGLDGEISRLANALPRWLRAHGGYALSLPSALLAFQPFSITLNVAQPGRAEFLPRSQQPVMAAVFANTPVYGGGMRVAPRARMDDALLDVCVIREMPKAKLLTVFPSVYLGRHLALREVEYFTAPAARIETSRPMDVYADGEYVCPTPVEFGIAHKALTVIVPARKECDGAPTATINALHTRPTSLN